MLHTKTIPAKKKLGQVGYFPYGTDPGNQWLRTGREYPKADFDPRIYNIFPGNFKELATNIVPAPLASPGDATASSSYDFEGTGGPWLAFNTTWGGARYSQYVGGSRVGLPQGIQLNTNADEYYISEYSLMPPQSNATGYSHGGGFSITGPFCYSGALEAYSKSSNITLILDKQDNVEFALGETKIFKLEQIARSPFSSFRGTFTSSNQSNIADAYGQGGNVLIQRIETSMVSVQTYIEKTLTFKIPDVKAIDGYYSYIYIGPENPIDMYQNPYNHLA